MATPLHTIKTSKFPLNWKRYSRMHAELEAAADGFYQLGHRDLAEAVDRARKALTAAWDEIQAKEQAERANAERPQQEGR